MTKPDCQDVLTLVIPHLTSKLAVVRCSLVSQHIRSVVLADIQQRFHQLLLAFMFHIWDDIGQPESFDRGRAGALQWFCSSAGRERMACPDTALTVLTGPRLDTKHLQQLVEAGLCLTDEVVMQAAARRVRDLQQLVSQLLEVTPPGKQQEQHGGLSEGVKHLLSGQEVTPKAPPQAAASSARWLGGALHIMCNRPVASGDKDDQDDQDNWDTRMSALKGFKLLLNQYIQQGPDQADQQRQQQNKGNSSSTPCSRTHPASASSQAGGQHKDLLSLPMHEVLLHVLRTCVIRNQGSYAAEVVAALLQLPADKQPGPHACAELFTAAAACSTTCVPILTRLPATRNVPGFVYVSLLKAGVSWEITEALELHSLLSLPQAQAITAVQLFELLMCFVNAEHEQGVAHLLSLPAAAALDSQQVLQLFKAAVRCDGLKEARFASKLDVDGASELDDEDDEVPDAAALAMLAPLAERLTEQGVVELLQAAVYNKWRIELDAILETSAIAEKLGPQSFLRVLESYVATYVPSHFKSLLAAPCAKHLPHGTAYRALHTLAINGFSISPACQETDWAAQLTTEDCKDLMQLALQHDYFTDVSTLCKLAPAAQQLDPQSVLQMALPLLHSMRGEGCGDTHQQIEQAVKRVLSLPGVAALSAQECNQLVAVVVQRGNMEALQLLLKQLPSHFEPKVSSRDLLLLVSKSFLDWKGVTHPLLGRGQVAAQLSTGDVVQLLLCLIPQTSHLSHSAHDLEASDAVQKAWKEKAADCKALEQKLCRLLDLLLPARQLTTDDMMALLRCSVSHGLLKVTHKLLGLSLGHAELQDGESNTPMSVVEIAAGQASQQCNSGDLLGRAEFYQLLLCCAGLNLEQLVGGCTLKLELFECLLGRAALYGFDGASVCSLVVACVSGFPWEDFKNYALSLAHNRKCSHHPVTQLLRLPGVDVLDAGHVCAMLDACIAAGSIYFYMHDVLHLPAAAQLSVGHIHQLAQACVLHQNAEGLRMILKHPAAPSADDPDVQLLNGLFRHR